MFYKKFGRDGPTISEIGMGTYYDPLWMIGAYFGWRRGYRQKITAIKTGLDGGVDFIDTAEIYQSEQIVAQAIKGYKREDIFLATKVWSNHLHHDSLIKSLNKSLERLDTHYIDLYQIHFPNKKINIKETMGAMEELIDEGKIRYIGLSNFNMDEIIRARESLKKYDVSSIQLRYNLIDRGVERDILPYCLKEGISFIAYYPLAHGKIVSNSKLSSLELKYEKTSSQLALNWLCSKPNVFPIPRASSVKHVREDVDVSGWRLNESDLKIIENIYA